jgi:hypothetical protein
MSYEFSKLPKASLRVNRRLTCHAENSEVRFTIHESSGVTSLTAEEAQMLARWLSAYFPPAGLGPDEPMPPYAQPLKDRWRE